VESTAADPASNRQTQKPSKISCLGHALAVKGLSIAIDAAGSIPAVGNLVSGVAATARSFDRAFSASVALSATGNALMEPDEGNAGSATISIGLIATDAALGGTKAIPIVGNVFSGLTGLYDIYGAFKTYQQCIAGPN
jgi:hypothetical protein